MNNNIRFVSPLYDTTFKYLWKKETSRDWFIKLIKLIAHIDLNDYELYDPELNSGNEIKDYKLDILFIKKDEKEHINIEMYKDYKPMNNLKSAQYSFRILGDSLKKGEMYKEHKLIQINFYNTYFNQDNNKRNIRYQMRDETGEFQKDYIQVYEIYLSSCKGICYTDGDELRFMLSFLNANSYEEMKMIASENKEALEVMSDLEDLAMQEEFLGVYDKNKENIILQNSMYDYGLKEGFEEGLNKRNVEIAKRMKENGEILEKISKYTGLSTKEIEKL